MTTPLQSSVLYGVSMLLPLNPTLNFLRSVLFQRKFSEVVTKSFFFVFNDVVLEL